ncbi:MAG: hypothetical protein WAW88_14110, partial [Nocardioides sp.]
MNDSSEPVGSLVEEAVRLVAVLAEMLAVPMAGLGTMIEAALQALETGEAPEHPGGADGTPAECEWCPLCRLIALVRGTNPEVRAHLVAALVSIAQAALALTRSADEARAPGDGAGDAAGGWAAGASQRRTQGTAGVEHIDLQS